MNKKEAKEITGGLSAPGKMPEGSYNLPARACITGAKLRPSYNGARLYYKRPRAFYRGRLGPRLFLSLLSYSYILNTFSIMS